VAGFQTEDNDGKPLRDKGAKTADSLKLQAATVIQWLFDIKNNIREDNFIQLSLVSATDITVLSTVSKKTDTTRLQ